MADFGPRLTKDNTMLAMPKTESRIVRRTQSAEMERRWSLVRDHMHDQGLQAVIAMGCDDYLGGYVRWLCDRPAANAYPVVAIFHADAPMSLIEHGPRGGRQDVSKHPEFSGVEELLTTTSWRSVPSTYRNEADIACSVLKSRGYHKVGMVGSGGMPFAFVEALTETGVELVDATAFFDLCKAIKSDVELEEIRATAAMQDEIFQCLLNQIKPGMRDLDVAAIAQFEARRRGSEQGIVMVSSKPIGQPTLMATAHFQNRTFERGDHLTVLIEVNGPAGYYTELGRTIVLGKATPELQDAMSLAVSAQRNVLGRMTNGALCADIAATNDSFLGSHGLQAETRVFSHGQGYDLVEWPLVRDDEATALVAGMNVPVHPSFVQGGAFGFVCDNFIVQPDGAPMRIHATPQRLFEI